MHNNVVGMLIFLNVAIQLISMLFSYAVTKFRNRCSVIRDYPLHRVDLLNDLVRVFAEGTPSHVRIFCTVYHGASY